MGKMKQLLSRILCLFMAFQVLFASTGMAVMEHLCQIKSAKSYSLNKNKSCCLSEKKSNFRHHSKASFKKVKCCKEFAGLKKISTDASQKETNLSKIFQSDLLLVRQACFLLPRNLPFLLEKGQNLCVFSIYYPPGQSIIILNRQFLI